MHSHHPALPFRSDEVVLLVGLLQEDHHVAQHQDVDQKTGGRRPVPLPARVVRQQRRAEEVADTLKQQLSVLGQNVGLLELLALVTDMTPGVHSVVNFQQSLASLLLSHLAVHINQD